MVELEQKLKEMIDAFPTQMCIKNWGFEYLLSQDGYKFVSKNEPCCIVGVILKQSDVHEICLDQDMTIPVHVLRDRVAKILSLAYTNVLDIELGFLAAEYPLSKVKGEFQQLGHDLYSHAESQGKIYKSREQ